MTEQEYINCISTEPDTEMIKEARSSNGDLEYRYIPKSILQKELLIIYGGNTQWEMLRDTIGKEGMWGTGVLKVKNPVSGEWLNYTGTASLMHFKNLKLNYPNLESQCFKNACKKIGVRFGQIINLDIDDVEPQQFGMEAKVDVEHSINKEYDDIIIKLTEFEYREDAEQYLQTTPFRHLLPAKKIVNLKPSKK